MIHLSLSDLPAFAHTPTADIPPVHSRVVQKFHTHTTRPLAYRLEQLRSFYWALKDAEPALLEACKADLGKSAYETYLTEVGWILNDIVFMSKNLERFMKDENAEDVGLTNMAMRPKIRKDPLGAVLVIGAYNFPIQLSLGPLVGAISAGCTAVLKPSENAPNAARVMQHIISQSLDPEAYQVVQGAVPETTALLDCKWDKIFYTGSATVGKIIAKRAAETLTPVTLELGGRNPAIVTANADLRLAARRLLWAKLLNVGQVCVSQNYILADASIVPELVLQLQTALNEFHPAGTRASADYGKVVNERQWDRLAALLDSTSGEILLGGKTDRDTLFFEPTVVRVGDADDALLKDESFGPLIPILPFTDLDQAIHTANAIHATPLGIYPFGTRRETDLILSQTRSGGASVNDGFFHASIPTLAFGGVGDSGQGAYRGRASFECFSHRRSVTSTPGWIESLLDVRYPPYTEKKMRKLRGMTDLKPDFDRQGRSTRGPIVRWLLSFLGARGLWWAILAAVFAMGVRNGWSLGLKR